MASETLADIMAGMRYGTVPKHQTDHELLALYADRIEAAAKRELEAVGNAAAIRDALANLVDVIDRCDSGSPLWWHCGAKGVKPLKDAKAALAKPPRNCDIYTTEDAVDTATVTVRDECGACPSMDMEAPCVFCMVRWLLAPAKKGGARRVSELEARQ